MFFSWRLNGPKLCDRTTKLKKTPTTTNLLEKKQNKFFMANNESWCCCVVWWNHHHKHFSQWIQPICTFESYAIWAIWLLNGTFTHRQKTSALKFNESAEFVRVTRWNTRQQKSAHTKHKHWLLLDGTFNVYASLCQLAFFAILGVRCVQFCNKSKIKMLFLLSHSY